ncbi:MAG: acyltransferase [Bacteroidetes bacterium]|nr:acyltransferase [Bacteroidota bacterium]
MSELKFQYFKGLDGIRALAAIGVLISHVFLAQHHFGLTKTGSLPIGRYGVTIFFTLSGFLITYLLITEKEKTSSIKLFPFYIRRILRIWPLYFGFLALCIGSYIFVFNIEPEHINYIFLFVFFLPNIAFNLNLYPQSTSHLWSIGIEEQFYIFWPLVISKISNLKRFIYIFIIGLIALKIIAILISNATHIKAIESIFSSLKYDCMAIGALFALNINNKRLLQLVQRFNLYIIVAFLLFYFGSFFLPVVEIFSILNDDVISMLTGLFIYTQIFSKSSHQILEWKIIKYLGKISFGIYVFHPLILAFFEYILYKKPELQFPNITILILSVIISTIAVSSISYYGYESYFLRKKAKFIS